MAELARELLSYISYRSAGRPKVYKGAVARAVLNYQLALKYNKNEVLDSSITRLDALQKFATDNGLVLPFDDKLKLDPDIVDAEKRARAAGTWSNWKEIVSTFFRDENGKKPVRTLEEVFAIAKRRGWTAVPPIRFNFDEPSEMSPVSLGSAENLAALDEGSLEEGVDWDDVENDLAYIDESRVMDSVDDKSDEIDYYLAFP